MTRLSVHEGMERAVPFGAAAENTDNASDKQFANMCKRLKRLKN